MDGFFDTAVRARIDGAVQRDLELIAAAVRDADPTSNATTFPFAGGHAVFLGHGLFVNRAIGAGLDRSVSPAELDDFEQRSAELGHAPAIDVSTETDSSLVTMLIERGYEPGDPNTSMARDLSALPSPDPAFRIDVVTKDTLEQWCAATASGWGHASADARANSDRYAKAAFVAQTPGLLLAHDASGNRVVGCGALAIIDGVALLGGMSVLPEERGRGVQSAMIAHRLNLAAELGADLAVTGAATGSQSERNLRRAGFEPIFETTTHTRTDHVHAFDFDPPEPLSCELFHLEVLGPEHNERDYEAWTSSMDFIHTLPGFTDRPWPHPMTLEENMEDMEMHAREYDQRKGYTYSILDGDDIIGCVYIYPPKTPDADHDARVRSWVRVSRADDEPAVRSTLRDWLDSAWPLDRIDY